MGARRACGHSVLAWALPAVTHRDGGGRRVGHHHRNEERGNPPLALGKTDLDLFFKRADAADAGAEPDADVAPDAAAKARADAEARETQKQNAADGPSFAFVDERSPAAEQPLIALPISVVLP